MMVDVAWQTRLYVGTCKSRTRVTWVPPGRSRSGDGVPMYGYGTYLLYGLDNPPPVGKSPKIPKQSRILAKRCAAAPSAGRPSRTGPVHILLRTLGSLSPAGGLADLALA